MFFFCRRSTLSLLLFSLGHSSVRAIQGNPGELGYRTRHDTRDIIPIYGGVPRSSESPPTHTMLGDRLAAALRAAICSLFLLLTMSIKCLNPQSFRAMAVHRPRQGQASSVPTTTLPPADVPSQPSNSVFAIIFPSILTSFLFVLTRPRPSSSP